MGRGKANHYGPYYDTLIQLSSGRLLYPKQVCCANQDHPDLPLEYVRSDGIWTGVRRLVSGHYHWPETTPPGRWRG